MGTTLVVLQTTKKDFLVRHKKKKYVAKLLNED